MLIFGKEQQAQKWQKENEGHSDYDDLGFRRSTNEIK